MPLFTIAGGQILERGAPIDRRGINVYDSDMDTVVAEGGARPLLRLFPGLRLVRVPCYNLGKDTGEYFANAVAELTGQDILVIFEHHFGISKIPLVGRELADECAWYGRLAAFFKNNELVAFASPNEPGGQNGNATICPQHAATYKAVRDASEALFGICMLGGGNPGTIGAVGGMLPETYRGMRRVFMEFHSYGFHSKYQPNQAATDRALEGSVSGANGLAGCRSLRTADGIPPVAILEFGDSTSGNKPLDANAVQVIESVRRAGMNGVPWAAWNWHPNATADNLTEGGKLTDFGRTIAALIAEKMPMPTGAWRDSRVDGMAVKTLLPDGYDPAVPYPAILFLHQMGMGADPVGEIRMVDAWLNTAEFRAKHKCIVVLPLLDQKGDNGERINWGGVSADDSGLTAAIAAVRATQAAWSVDVSRIYLAGNSMGAMGGWAAAIRYNGRNGTKDRIFAAFLLLAGANYTDSALSAGAQLGGVPIWSIHGAGDKQVPLVWDRSVAALLNNTPAFTYTEDANLAHNVWDTYFPQSRVWDWLFNQRSEIRPMPASADNATISIGSADLLTDATGIRWGISPAGQVVINGVPDMLTGNVQQLAFCKSVIWQRNNANRWWSRSGNGWLPAGGTLTSPLPVAGITRAQVLEQMDSLATALAATRRAIEVMVP